MLLYYKSIIINYITFIIGDIIEFYAMHKESGIYKYWLIEKVIIPLHMTSPNVIYQLIHTLITLRITVTCTIYKILYNSNSENNKYNFNEMTITVSTSKNS